MFWLLISLFFCWLIYREITSPKVAAAGFTAFDIGYMAVLLCVAMLFAWRPYHYWRLEQFLTATAISLADNPAANVHCNTVFDSIFDNTLRVAGHANIESGDIVLQHPWCGTLMDYLDDPTQASDDEIWSLSLITHEIMHVRGERNELKTECQALQRNYRMAKLLGVPGDMAKEHAFYYYDTLYKNRHPYFTPECAPGKLLDEQLSDSSWPAH